MRADALSAPANYEHYDQMLELQMRKLREQISELESLN